MLGLEQNEANISEAESTRKQAEETIEQGRTLTLFTIIITIVSASWFLDLHWVNGTVKRISRIFQHYFRTYLPHTDYPTDEEHGVKKLILVWSCSLALSVAECLPPKS